MRRVWSGVLAAALASSVGLAAQGAGRGGDAAQEPAPGKEVTVNGCLQNAPSPAAGASPAPKYVLNIKPAGGGGRGSAGTRYRLDGDEKAMAPHLNHVVEVKGVVQPPGGAAASGEIPLKVAWVKMVAATCP